MIFLKFIDFPFWKWYNEREFGEIIQYYIRIYRIYATKEKS